MKDTLSTSQIADRLYRDENGGWSYEGAKAIAEWLEQLEEETDTEMELDVVAIRCDFSEHDSALACVSDNGYRFEPDPDEDEDEQEESALEYLRENTQVIDFEGGVIIQGF